MGSANNHIILYSPQDTIVWRVVNEFGISLSRREYIADKYEESAQIFLTAYEAFIREAEKIVPRCDSTAYPYWAFASPEQIDSMDRKVMKLEVPINEVVLFDQYDWYKVLRLSYIGETQADEDAFARKLGLRGIRDSSEAVLKPFYPDIKREITESWKRLFRHDADIRRGDFSGTRAVQAGLWRIKKEWLI